MESHHSTGWKWLAVILVMAIMVVLGIWVNSIFLLLSPMVLMHMFGHGSGQHSKRSPESSEEHAEHRDAQEHGLGCR